MDWENIVYNLDVSQLEWNGERMRRYKDRLRQKWKRTGTDCYCDIWGSQGGSRLIPVPIMREQHLINSFRWVMRHMSQSMDERDIDTAVRWWGFWAMVLKFEILARAKHLMARDDKIQYIALMNKLKRLIAATGYVHPKDEGLQS
jgi:hypothetical protein